MYQFVRSSMNATNGRTARWRSYSSIAAVTSAISVSIELLIQRSRTFGESGTTTASSWKPSTFA